MARAYDVEKVELKWQHLWEDDGTYQVENDDPREKFYALCMYPYPSGPAHQGHVRNYTFGDVAVRYQTMQGKAVLSPLGFDSFGLPAENAAIQTGTHPRIFTEDRIARADGLAEPAGRRLRLATRGAQPRPPVHQAQPAHLPAAVGGGPGLPRLCARELVSRLPDGPGQRAGPARRHLRALRRHRDPSRPRAMVLPHHAVRRRAPRRPRRPRLARAGEGHATQLDRPLRGRRVRPRRPGGRGREAPRLHYPARHQLRHDLRRHRPRAPPARRLDHRPPSAARSKSSGVGPARRPTSSG